MAAEQPPISLQKQDETMQGKKPQSKVRSSTAQSHCDLCASASAGGEEAHSTQRFDAELASNRLVGKTR